MSIKGWPDQQKTGDRDCQFATVQPIRAQQHALDVVANAFAYAVGSDTAETGSSTSSVAATGHSAARGDIIQFTSGALSGMEFRVRSVAANAIVPVEVLPSAPANGDAFTILRQRTPRVDSVGGVYLSSGTVITFGGRQYADSVINDYSSTPVDNSAWVELIAATAAEFNSLLIFDSSGQPLELGVGAAPSESRVLLIPPGGFGSEVLLNIPAGSRLSLRSLTANASSAGYMILTGLQ